MHTPASAFYEWVMRAQEPALGPPYLIRTPRMTLRCFRPEDAALRKDAVDHSGAHLALSFPPGADGPMSLERHAAQIRQLRSAFDADEARSYAALNKEETRLLGEVGLHGRRSGIGALEISYWLRKDACGQGLATEMACALIRCAFELDGVVRVDLMCAPENTRSAAMARRLGFTLEGRLRQRQLVPHRPRTDLISYSMLGEDFPMSPAAVLPLEAFDFLGRPL